MQQNDKTDRTGRYSCGCPYGHALVNIFCTGRPARFCTVFPLLLWRSQGQARRWGKNLAIHAELNLRSSCREHAAIAVGWRSLHMPAFQQFYGSYFVGMHGCVQLCMKCCFYMQLSECPVAVLLRFSEDFLKISEHVFTVPLHLASPLLSVPVSQTSWLSV